MQGTLDDLVYSVENGIPPLTYDEEYMGDESANYQRLEKRVSKIEEKGAKSRTVELLATHTGEMANTLGRIEIGLEWQEKFLKYSVSGALIWLVGMSGYLVSTMGRVSALEGKGGSYTATEKALDKPQTPREATANLNLLQAQIQKRAISKYPLSELELARVGTTLNAVANRFPEIPAVWNVSSQLVNLRFTDTQTSVSTGLPNCWDTYKGRATWSLDPNIPTPPDRETLDEQVMGNCRLTLDDGPQFRDSGFGKAYEENLKRSPNMKLRLWVHDAVVTYSGGKLIPYAVLNCQRCVFRATITKPPTPEGRQVVGQLLTADISNINLIDSKTPAIPN